MQISGAIDFFSHIRSRNWSVGAQNNTFSPAQAKQSVKTPQSQAATDSLSLSDTGKKLSLNIKKAPALTENQKAETNDKVEIKDYYLKIVDKYMSQAKSILEKMHEFAITAQDKSLEDIDRVNLQIEFEDLRDQLVIIPGNIVSEADGRPTLGRIWDNPAPSPVGDGSSLLGRMQERIVNGQEWNVREVFNEYNIDRIMEGNEEGEFFVERFQKGCWYVVDDQNVPTVHEKLERETPVVLMDAESAAEGAALLEDEIESVQKWIDTAEMIASEQEHSEDGKATTSSVMFLYSVYYSIAPTADKLHNGHSLFLDSMPLTEATFESDIDFLNYDFETLMRDRLKDKSIGPKLNESGMIEPYPIIYVTPTLGKYVPRD